MGCRGPMFGGMGGLGAGGGGSAASVTPPALTSEAVAAGGSPTAHTFGAFTDPDARITSYASAIEAAVGAVSASGSGLGPYTYSGATDGDSFAHTLTALDASGDPLATAVHAVDVAVPGVLVAGTPPTSQALASGTTSSGSITWTAPTGGSGSYTLAVALAHVVGSGAALSGSGNSRTVTGLADGDVVTVTGTWTDDETGQAVAQTAVVSVAVTAGDAGWVNYVDLDLTGLTAGGPWSTGTNNVVKGGSTIITATTVRSGTTDGTVAAATAGVEVKADSGTGNVSLTLNLDTLIPTNDAFFTAEGVVITQIGCVLDLTTLPPGSGSYAMVGVSALTGQGQPSAGVILNYSGGNVVISTFYDSVTGVTLYSGAYPTNFLVTIETYGGRNHRVRLDLGTTAPVAPSVGLANTFPGQPVYASSTAQPMGTNYHALVSVKADQRLHVVALRTDRLENL